MRFLTMLVSSVVLLFVWMYPQQTLSSTSFIYTSPRPSAQRASAGTTVSLRAATTVRENSLDPALFHIVGSESGVQEGRVLLAGDQQTVIFEPEEPFMPGEVVAVTVNRGIETESGDTLEGIDFEFTISSKPFPYENEQNLTDVLEAEDQAGSDQPKPDTAHSRAVRQEATEYATVPDTFPAITVTTPAQDTGDGYIFLSNFIRGQTLTDPMYLMILDNSGEPIYYKEFPVGQAAFDFKMQPNGMLTYFSRQTGNFQVMDESYNIVDSIRAGNGYPTDIHELQVLPNNHALLMIYDYQPVDMSDFGGLPDARVIDLIIQELDTVGNVVFEWNSSDYFTYTDTLIDLTEPIVDYAHGNAIELDVDGNLMISSRHMSEITKIDRETGDIVWRLGGKQNEFDFVNDELFHFQHDIRRLLNGNITLFDNRTDLSPQYSRAVEYELDEENKTITRVWEYRNTPDVYSFAMGSHQRLPNGNALIGWGSAFTTTTEVTPDGTKAFELTFDPPFVSYRAFRFPWQGFPTTDPTLVITTTDALGEQLAYSWNGATEIDSYGVYAGESPVPTTLIETAEKTGFETSTSLESIDNNLCFFRVMPIDNQGEETRYSNTVYRGDDACATALTVDPTTSGSKTFPSTQEAQPFSTTLTVAAGTVPTTSTLLYAEATTSIGPVPDGLTFADLHFTLDVYQDNQTVTDLTFTEPATLTIEYDSATADMLDEMSLELRAWDSEARAWSGEDITLVDQAADENRQTYTITRLGEFALFGRSVGQLDDAQLYLPIISNN